MWRDHCCSDRPEHTATPLVLLSPGFHRFCDSRTSCRLMNWTATSFWRTNCQSRRIVGRGAGWWNPPSSSLTTASSDPRTSVDSSGEGGVGHFPFPAREIGGNERLRSAVWCDWTLPRCLRWRRSCLLGTSLKSVEAGFGGPVRLAGRRSSSFRETELPRQTWPSAFSWFSWWLRGEADKIGLVSPTRTDPLPRPHIVPSRRPWWIGGRQIRRQDPLKTSSRDSRVDARPGHGCSESSALLPARVVLLRSPAPAELFLRWRCRLPFGRRDLAWVGSRPL